MNLETILITALVVMAIFIGVLFYLVYRLFLAYMSTSELVDSINAAVKALYKYHDNPVIRESFLSQFPEMRENKK